MLFEQIRYAEITRKLYRLRNLLVHKAHPDVGSRVGYSKYSKQFYRIKKKLTEEGVLSREGRFVDNILNLWLVEIAFHATKEQQKVLGNRVPYNVFLAVSLNSPKKTSDLTREINFSRKAIYLAVNKLEKAGLIKSDDSMIFPQKEEKAYNWLIRYLDLCKTYADTTNDISILFNTVPAYIGGPQAHYIVNYEPGRPAGPADMSIITFKPFVNFWESAIREISYFRDYPKHVTVSLAKPKDRIVWIDKLPYKRTRKV